MEVQVRNRQRRHRVDRELLERVAVAALEALECGDCLVDVTLVSDRAIRILNRDYRGKDRPTDVLSFPQEGDELAPTPPGFPRLLGDIVLSVETAARQMGEHTLPGRDDEASLHRELAFLLLHGILHLLGHDHESSEDEQRMEAVAERVWATVAALVPPSR